MKTADFSVKARELGYASAYGFDGINKNVILRLAAKNKIQSIIHGKCTYYSIVEMEALLAKRGTTVPPGHTSVKALAAAAKVNRGHLGRMLKNAKVSGALISVDGHKPAFYFDPLDPKVVKVLKDIAANKAKAAEATGTPPTTNIVNVNVAPKTKNASSDVEDLPALVRSMFQAANTRAVAQHNNLLALVQRAEAAAERIETAVATLKPSNGHAQTVSGVDPDKVTYPG